MKKILVVQRGVACLWEKVIRYAQTAEEKMKIVPLKTAISSLSVCNTVNVG